MDEQYRNILGLESDIDDGEMLQSLDVEIRILWWIMWDVVEVAKLQGITALGMATGHTKETKTQHTHKLA